MKDERITDLWLDTTNHIALYDVGTYVDPAIDRIDAWMQDHLTA